MPTSNQSVQKLIEDVRRGTLVLPDFQRRFVWKPDDVQELLVSVLGDYYIGSMLYMDAIRDEAPFALRLVEGAKDANPEASIDSIVRILLDGQQRTSSLFYSLFAPPIALAGRKSPYRFYSKIDRLLTQDWENAVDFVNTSNKPLTAKMENSEEHIAFAQFKDVGALSQRLMNSKYKADLARLVQLINSFNTYEIQMVHLDRGTPLSRVVETFERINKTGLPLAVTDLLVAKLYRDGVKLRDLIKEAAEKYVFFDPTGPDYVLRVLSLGRGTDVRRNTILELKASGFVEEWWLSCEALSEAFRRLQDPNHYGVIDVGKWAPASSMLVTLAALIDYLRRNKKTSANNYKKVDEWYWTTVFGNRYNEGVNTNTLSDYQRIIDWFTDDAKIPDFIKKFHVPSIDLYTDSRTSAVYRGVISLVVKAGAKDFKTGKEPAFEPSRVQDDHIFPRKIFKTDIVLNRTLISTNQEKSDAIPGDYFKALLTINGREVLLELLRSHLIDGQGLEALLANKLDDFLGARERAIRDAIAALTPHRAPGAVPEEVEPS